MKFETVCGLEVHTELLTKTKIFCSCANEFGAEPNSRTCAFCSGMPGTLPVLNERVLEFAVRCALALHCEIEPVLKFDRKNYFYPDLPKAYQISQLYLPVCRNGYVEIEDSINGGTKRVGIHEIHMEEDAGKLLHEDGKTLINYNRAGVPLLEIVSEPDISNGKEAAEYTRKLRQILMFSGISDCKMQEGSLRADVNVSVREKGSKTLKTRTEMKNLSSFKEIALAVDTEAKRQQSVIEQGGRISLETRRWDEEKSISVLMRTKETASDYKYFPEPDIPPIELDGEYIEKVKHSMPELYTKKLERYKNELKLSDYDADFLTSETEISNLFESTLDFTNEPKETANWIMTEVAANGKYDSVSPEKLAKIINLVKQSKITRQTGKDILALCFKNDIDIDKYIGENSLETVSDSKLIINTVKKVIADNEKAVSEYKQGKEKSFNFLVGQVMRALKGKASAQQVREIMQKEIQR